jgi:hypothetical protein
MFSTALGLALIGSLAVAVLPVPRVRRWLLTAAARLGQAVVLAALGACGTFFVQPQAAPAWLADVARPLVEGTLGLTLDTSTSLPWLLLAVLAVGVSLPVLLAVELAVSLADQAALVQSLRREIRQAAAWVDQRLAALGVTGPSYPAVASEGAAAAEAIRSAGPGGKHTPPVPAPLVLDLLK